MNRLRIELITKLPQQRELLGFLYLSEYNVTSKKEGLMPDRINNDLTIDIACPVCEKLLPRRGVKGQIVGVHHFTCQWCSEDFTVTIDPPEKAK